MARCKINETPTQLEWTIHNEDGQPYSVIADKKDGLADEFFFVILIMNALRHSYAKI